MDDAPPTVDEFVEYCRVQAGLLSGHVETMSEEADALLDEVDERLADARERLGDRAATDGPESPQTPGPDGDDEALAELEADIEETQALVEAKQARMQAFQSLAADYTDLAVTLDDEITDPQEALERVVEFEAEHDAPLYFEARTTLYESVEER